jgi:hypothetical protein
VLASRPPASSREAAIDLAVSLGSNYLPNCRDDISRLYERNWKRYRNTQRAGLRGSRQLKGRKAALVLVAVEKRGRVTGRARMALIPDFKNTTPLALLKQNVMAGSTVL